MKKLFCTFLMLFAFIRIQAQEPLPDLLSRLKRFDPQRYNMSVENLKQKFADTYRPAKGWETALEHVKENREAWIAALKTGNTKNIREIEKNLDLLDANLLGNPLLKDKQILVIKRKLDDGARSATGYWLGIGPSNFQNNSEIPHPAEGWNNEVVKIVCSAKPVEQTVYTPASGKIVSDIEPHWDGRRFMFSSIGANNRWHLFEMDVQTSEVRQLTPDTYVDFDSFDGCYTPDGNYIFCSTGTFLGLPCTHGWNKMCGLFLYNPATGITRQLTFDQDSNWGPVVMPDGKILYQRWEYSDLPHANSRILFTMNPDGTNQSSYYGSNSFFPASFFNARPVPGSSSRVAGIASGHHSVARTGRLLCIDVAKGRKEAEGVVAEIPRYGEKVRPWERDRLPDGQFPYFMFPYPLDDTYFLVSMKPTENSLVGLYLVDIYNNMICIAESEGYAYLEPVVLEKKNVPPVIPSKVDTSLTTATVFMQDVYFGPGLSGVPRGTVKKLRIGAYYFSPFGQGGAIGAIGMDGPWDVKQIVGTVDVEEDGSAMFTVPANTALFVQPLDAEGKALQVMRSWFTAMPGETLSCIGCHEDKNTIVPPKVSFAAKNKPQTIAPWYGRPRGFSYRHEIQPVLDRACVACHNDGNTAIPSFEGKQWITDWRSDIAGNAGGQGGKFTRSYANLHRYVRRPGIESGMDMLSPMDVHADQTELMQILQKGHHGVSLLPEEWERLACWIDFNAPFHGRRTEIGDWQHALPNVLLKKKYASFFQVKPFLDPEELPPLPEPVDAVMPSEISVIPGDSTADGWPHYDVSAIYDQQKGIKKGNYEAWNQINLGMMRKILYLTDDIALELVKVPAGQFLMGGGNPDEMPRTRVTIDKPFWIGRFEITNKQYGCFDSRHDSGMEYRHGFQFGRKGYPLNHPDQPVVRISWQEAMAFCEWLSKETGMDFTLPTEAEWEWACRAGSDTPFWFGDLAANFSNYANLGDIKLKEFAACTYHKNYESVRIIDNPTPYDDWIPRDTSYNDGGFVSEQVGRYRPNEWDLCDMHGNVWEWTRSSYRPYPYSETDGRNEPASNEKRVARGGSWYDRPYRATSSFRLPYRDYQKVFNVGFRVVMHEEE